MPTSLHHRDTTSPRLRRLVWASLVLLATTAQATTGLTEIPGQVANQEPVVVFYPTDAEGPSVQRWQFSLPVVE